MHTLCRILVSVRPLLLGVLLCSTLFGGVSSFTGTLFAEGVSVLPVIQTQPESQTVGVGAAEVILRVTANSTAALTYQWRKGGVSIVGGTAASYRIAPVYVTDAGRYDVIVTNSAVPSSTSSSVATLTVLSPPTITVQPSNVRVVQGNDAKLSVTTSGTGLTYQWFKSSADSDSKELIPGATAAVYVVPADQIVSGTFYGVDVSNGPFSLTSTRASVLVGARPVINDPQPEGVTAAPGGSATFRVFAVGGVGVTYQWRKAGVNITGGTASSFSIPAVASGNAGVYDVVVSNGFGSVTSEPAVLEVASAPSITLQPNAVSVGAGGLVVLEVGVAGTGPLSYRWFKASGAGSRVEIQGATSGVYQISGAQVGDGGSYTVDVTNIAGTVSSAPIALTVIAAGGVVINEQPLGGSVLLGSPYAFSVGVGDTAPVSYQWRKGGVPITGATASTYALAAVQTADVGCYDVLVRNAAGVVNSVPAFLGLASAVSLEPYQWTTLAGSPGVSGTADGSGGDARFNVPVGIALSASGTLYVSDSENSVIRKVTAGGVVTTFAGVMGTPGILDGAALTARFDSPQGIALDPSGNLFVADSNNNVVRKISAQGQVTTLGVAFDGPRRVAVDPSGNLYVLDNFTLQKVSPNGTATVLMGDTLGTAVFFPQGMAVDKNGRLFVAAFDGAVVHILKRSDAGIFVDTGFGPYDFELADLTFGLGGNLYAASGNSVFFLGDTASTANPPEGLPVSLMDLDASQIYPRAIAVSDSGTIFGVDPFNFMVLRGAVVVGLPALLSQPVSAANSPLALRIWAEGEGLTYQWLYRDAPITGANAQELKIPAAQLSNPGNFKVIVSNAAGSVTSLPATFTGVGPLFISSHPSNRVATSGDAVSFEVGVTGQAPFTYQWRKGGVAISGGTGATYTITGAKIIDSGSYDVVVKSPTNATGVTSRAALLQVNVPAVPAQVFSQPESLELVLGARATFNVAASGTAPITYQWKKGVSEIPGATLPSYSIAAVGSGDVGDYSVVVANIAGFESSDIAKLSVCTPVSILASPQGSSVREGNPVTLTVGFAGTNPSFQWRKGGRPISGGTSSSYTISSVKAADADSYDVVVSNSVNTVPSSTASLVVETPVDILTQPASIAATVGVRIAFSVTATGTSPSYQWRKNGTQIPGETKPILVLTSPAEIIDAGTYDVVVFNAFSQKTSAAATLTIAPGRGISILQSPPAMVYCIQGTNAMLELAVDPLGEEMLRTTFRLLSTSGDFTGIAGTVPDNGVFLVPLKALVTAGTYRVEIAREYKAGAAIPPVNTAPFQVSFKGLDKAAGSYEILLEDVNGLLGDSATYRGLLVATVSKTGAVSGRVIYNEATALAPLVDASLRTYMPVTRSFNGTFSPSEEDALKLVCVPKTGALAPNNSQELRMELDFSGAAPQLNAFVKDRASLPGDEDGVLSAAVGGGQLLTKISTDMAGVVARYTLSTDSSLSQDSGPGSDNNAYILIQVLSTGRVLWTSRQSASAGSGSAGLSLQADSTLVAQFYEGRSLSPTAFHSSTSLFGCLFFTKTGAVWAPSLSAGYWDGRLERQSSYISKFNKKVNYDSLKFDLGSAFSAAFNWTGVTLLDFGGGACLWNGTAQGWLKFFGDSSVTAPVLTAPVLYLTAEDPAGEGGVFIWSLTLSSAGVIKTATYSPGGSLQPALSLRLDRTKGEWTGSYLPSNSKIRRNLVGASVSPQDAADPLRAQGWVELGVLPAIRTTAWKLENTPP